MEMRLNKDSKASMHYQYFLAIQQKIYGFDFVIEKVFVESQEEFFSQSSNRLMTANHLRLIVLQKGYIFSSTQNEPSKMNFKTSSFKEELTPQIC